MNKYKNFGNWIRVFNLAILIVISVALFKDFIGCNVKISTFIISFITMEIIIQDNDIDFIAYGAKNIFISFIIYNVLSYGSVYIELPLILKQTIALFIALALLFRMIKIVDAARTPIEWTVSSMMLSMGLVVYTIQTISPTLAIIVYVSKLFFILVCLYSYKTITLEARAREAERRRRIKELYENNKEER